MHRKPMLWYSFLFLTAGAAIPPAAAQQLGASTAQQLIDHSIAYHDPEGAWGHESYRLVIVGTRPIAGPTSTTIIIDNVAGRFSMTRERFGNVIESTVTGDDCWTRLNGSSDLTEQQIKRFDLGCEQMRW